MNRCLRIPGFLLPVLLVASGCHMWDYRYQAMDHQHGWDPVLGSCDVCGVCGGDCVGHTPCQHAKHLLTCAAGCGDIYWGEWISDPPDPCDPCDNCGSWVGPTCCQPGFFERFRSGWPSWWGYRFSDYGGEIVADEYQMPEIGVMEEDGVLLGPESMQSFQPPLEGDTTPPDLIPDKHAKTLYPRKLWQSRPRGYANSGFSTASFPVRGFPSQQRSR